LPAAARPLLLVQRGRQLLPFPRCRRQALLLFSAGPRAPLSFQRGPAMVRFLSLILQTWYRWYSTNSFYSILACPQDHFTAYFQKLANAETTFRNSTRSFYSILAYPTIEKALAYISKEVNSQ
jgi:hypothetical protein